MAEERPRRGFFGRALAGGFFGCLGAILAVVVVVVIIIVVIAIAVSGGDDAEVVQRGATATLAPGETPGEDGEEPDVLNLSIGDTARVGDAEVTTHGFRTSAGDEYFGPDPGNTWIIVDATVLNTGDDPYNMSSLLQLAVRDGEGREYSVTIGPDLQGLLDGTIPPGDILRGEAAFEVPEGAPGLQFVFAQAIGTQQARWNLR